MPVLKPEIMHPLMVHFPIVLLIALAMTDHVALFAGRNLGGQSCLPNISALLAVLAGATAMFVYVNGSVAYDIALTNGTSPVVLDMHRDLGAVLTVLALIWAVLRGWILVRQRTVSRMWNILVASTSLGLAILVVVVALYGTGLVYAHGVNVVVPGT